MKQETKKRTGLFEDLLHSPNLKKGDVVNSTKRVVFVHPSPFYKISMKVMQKINKTNAQGDLMRMSGDTSKVAKTDVEVDSIQLPGTHSYLVAPQTANGLLTGLNVLVPNPYKDEKFFNQKWANEELEGKDKVLLQHILEYKHGEQYNYYTNKLKNNFNGYDVENDAFFLKPQARREVKGGSFALDLDKNIDEVHYYMLKAHPLVANSWEELQENRYAYKYYISDTMVTKKYNTNRIIKQNEAIAKLVALKEEREGLMIAFTKALEIKEPDLVNDNKAFLALDIFLKEDEKNIDSFNVYYAQYRNAPDREKFYAAALLNDFIEENLIRRSNQSYYYTRPATNDTAQETFVFNSKDRVINDFLLSQLHAEDVNIMHQKLAQLYRMAY